MRSGLKGLSLSKRSSVPFEAEYTRETDALNVVPLKALSGANRRRGRRDELRRHDEIERQPSRSLGERVCCTETDNGEDGKGSEG